MKETIIVLNEETEVKHQNYDSRRKEIENL